MRGMDDVIARIQRDDARDPLRLAMGRWPPSSPAELADLEADFGLRFPADFRRIVVTLGAGDIGYTWIYGVRPEQEPSIRRLNRSALQPHEDYIAFSDNGAGDYFGFVVRGSELGPEVTFLDHETGNRTLVYDSIASWLDGEAFLRT